MSVTMRDSIISSIEGRLKSHQHLRFPHNITGAAGTTLDGSTRLNYIDNELTSEEVDEIIGQFNKACGYKFAFDFEQMQVIYPPELVQE